MNSISDGLAETIWPTITMTELTLPYRRPLRVIALWNNVRVKELRLFLRLAWAVFITATLGQKQHNSFGHNFDDLQQLIELLPETFDCPARDEPHTPADDC